MGKFGTNRKIEGFVDDRNFTTDGSSRPPKRADPFGENVRIHPEIRNFWLRDGHVRIIRSGVTSRWADSL